FSVLAPNDSVSAYLGSSAILPCDLSPSISAETFEVRWYKNDDYDHPVLLYKDLKVQESDGDPQYRGRASLIGELAKGNVSLKLENLTVEDNGEYVCFVEGLVWYDKATARLLIKVLGSLPVLSFAEAGGQVNVTCASGGWLPKPTVTWRDSGGRELSNSHVQYKTDSDRLVSVSSWLLFSPSESEWISCSVGLSDEEMKMGRVLPLKADPQEYSPVETYLHTEKLTVDPDTRNRYLTMTREGTGVYCGHLNSYSQNQSDPFPRALSREEFSSGLKYWEVKVKRKLSWCVGVSQKPPTEETLTALCYEVDCGIYTRTDPRTEVPAEGQVTTLGLLLDFKHRLLSFYNVDPPSHLHTFTMENMENRTYCALISPGVKDSESVYYKLAEFMLRLKIVQGYKSTYEYHISEFRSFCDQITAGQEVESQEDRQEDRFTTASEFSLSVPNASVSEPLGSSAVLPCGLSPSLNAETFEIRWHRNDYNNPVLLYKDLQIQENTGDPQYRRVSLIGELEKGNVSLKLENLTLADMGEYVCYVKSLIWYESATVNLIVKALGSPPLFSLAKAGDQVNVTCASDGWSPKPTLTWRDRGGKELGKSHIHYKTAWKEAFISTLVLLLSIIIIIVILTALLLKTLKHQKGNEQKRQPDRGKTKVATSRTTRRPTQYAQRGSSSLSFGSVMCAVWFAAMLLILIASTLVCSTAASEFSLSVPKGSVSEPLGSSAVLPCGLSPSLNAETFEIRWHRNDHNNPVLLYKDLQIQENTGDPQYRRVSLTGELEKGNVSLKLENLTLADAGEYVCYVKSLIWYESATVNLIVKALGSPPLFSLAKAGDQVNVTCASDGWSPKPTLTWRDRGGRELGKSHIHYETDSEGLMSVSSWLLFPSSESEWISCSVGISDPEMVESRVHPV
ncbi:hypothetical protein NFI96_029399, partial [Prochilodus magdalenae]